MTELSKIIFPEFENIKVSTKTFIVITNLIFDIEKLFNFLPYVDFVVVPKRRGRKRKNKPEDPNKDISTGSIITLKYKNLVRGVDLKKKKQNKDEKKRGNFFRNSVTIVMIMDNKKINLKVSRNGKFQLTGCKYDDHAEKCVKYIWEYIKDSDDIYTFVHDKKIVNCVQYIRDHFKKINTILPIQVVHFNMCLTYISKYLNSPSVLNHVKNIKESTKNVGDSITEIENIVQKLILKPPTVLESIFVPAMRNIDFGFNFFVDREMLDNYFNTCTDHLSLLETSFGYTGVNIKIPLCKPITHLLLKKKTYDKNDWIDDQFIRYSDYLMMLIPKDVNKNLKKKRFNTFLVFHSGKCIMSGLDAGFMKKTYIQFTNIIEECKDLIEEKLDI